VYSPTPFLKITLWLPKAAGVFLKWGCALIF
jgi:hypothetical protein